MTAKPRLDTEQICAQVCATHSLKVLRKRANSIITGIKGRDNCVGQGQKFNGRPVEIFSEIHLQT